MNHNDQPEQRAPKTPRNARRPPGACTHALAVVHVQSGAIVVEATVAADGAGYADALGRQRS